MRNHLARRLFALQVAMWPLVGCGEDVECTDDSDCLEQPAICTSEYDCSQSGESHGSDWMKSACNR